MITVGTKVNEYLINEITDSSKTGYACLATDTQLDKRVVLKFYSSKYPKEQAQLAHPNIIGIIETGQYNNQHYLVLDYIEGKKLTEFIDEGSVSEEFVIDVAIQISDALAYAHSENVIHGNIASSNIIIDPDGRPRLTDFGFYDGKKKIKDDLYSLGALLYEMLTGKSPGDTIDTVTIKAGLDNYSEKIIDIIVKLIGNKKGSGFESAEELYKALVALPQSKKLSSQKPVDWWNRYVVPVAFVVILIMAIYWLFYN